MRHFDIVSFKLRCLLSEWKKMILASFRKLIMRPHLHSAQFCFKYSFCVEAHNFLNGAKTLVWAADGKSAAGATVTSRVGLWEFGLWASSLAFCPWHLVFFVWDLTIFGWDELTRKHIHRCQRVCVTPSRRFNSHRHLKQPRASSCTTFSLNIEQIVWFYTPSFCLGFSFQPWKFAVWSRWCFLKLM